VEVVHLPLSAGHSRRGRRRRLPLPRARLIGNGVRHGADHVRLTLDGDVLVVGVEDGSTVLPDSRDTDTDAKTGRGMCIVEALVETWGVTELARASAKRPSTRVPRARTCS
jgi:hypothetical protein